jgi:chromosome partitioning protein
VTDWHAGNRLPVVVESLPLGSERDAQKWVARVLTLKAGADHVVVDLPPQIGSGIASALLIADLFAIPVTPSGVDLRATGKALDLLRRARAVRGSARPACMLVPSRVDRRTAVGRRIYMTLERFGLRVGPALRQRSAHIEAFENGAWIGAHAPTSPAYRENPNTQGPRAGAARGGRAGARPRSGAPAASAGYGQDIRSPGGVVAKPGPGQPCGRLISAAEHRRCTGATAAAEGASAVAPQQSAARSSSRHGLHADQGPWADTGRKTSLVLTLGMTGPSELVIASV